MDLLSPFLLQCLSENAPNRNRHAGHWKGRRQTSMSPPGDQYKPSGSSCSLAGPASTNFCSSPVGPAWPRLTVIPINGGEGLSVSDLVVLAVWILK